MAVIGCGLALAPWSRCNDNVIMSDSHELHFTLRYRTNQIQAIIFAAGSGLLLAFVQPTPLYHVLFGIVLGFIVGLLNGRMLRRNGSELIRSKRSIDIAEIRANAQYGKWANGILAFGLLIMAGWLVYASNDTEGLQIFHGLSFLAGALAAISFRDFLCLPIYRELEALFAKGK